MPLKYLFSMLNIIIHTLEKSIRIFIQLHLELLKEKINFQFQLWNYGILLQSNIMKINTLMGFKTTLNYLVIKLLNCF